LISGGGNKIKFTITSRHFGGDFKMMLSCETKSLIQSDCSLRSKVVDCAKRKGALLMSGTTTGMGATSADFSESKVIHS
jgi:argininosuccinate lyase